MNQLYGEIDFPVDYPADLHIRLHTLAHNWFILQNTASSLQVDFDAAMKSVAYRYKTCIESGNAFGGSVQADGDAPLPKVRYFQEREFFSCIVAGIACLEALHYALFALGASIDGSIFQFANSQQQRKITPKLTQEVYAHFPNGRLVSAALRQIQDSQEYLTWSTIRNVLSHRGLPGRIFSLRTKSSTKSSKPPSRYHPFAEIDGPEILPDTFLSLHSWLAGVLQNIFGAAMSLFTDPV